MEEFDSIENTAGAIKTKLDSNSDKKKLLALYAFNATGKTRLTKIFSDINNETEDDAIRALCYNAFLEDLFTWDNESYILRFDPNSWIVKLILDQGLENNIVDNFKDIINSNISSKIEPSFDFTEGIVIFEIASGDNDSVENIKISRGEESIFIWAIFYTILEAAIDALDTDENIRTTSIFNELQYVIIDDPISSIDDTKIITMAIKLIELIDSLKNKSLRFFITTHHALFYNVLVNSFKNKPDYNFKSYGLSKDNQAFKLSKLGDSPFSYHLFVKDIIQDAIKNNNIEKYHFHFFRNLLEKTSNFLGYNNWADCISGDNRQKFIRLLNLYSHNRLSDLENRELSNEDKILFQETFNTFIRNFKWS